MQLLVERWNNISTSVHRFVEDFERMSVVSSIASLCPVFMGNINTLILSCPGIVFPVIAWP